jgi:hypothetical protein
MGFLVILPIGALAAWSIFATCRWLRRSAYALQWRKALTLLMAAGLALGIFFTFFLEYNVANVHLRGFPIPTRIGTREKPDEPYITADMPIAILAGAMLTDLISGVALCLAPIAIALFFKENKGKLAGPVAPNNPP